MYKNFSFFVLATICIATFNSSDVSAQNAPDYKDGLQVNLNGREDYFLRFMIWNQMWVRSIENNPGTMINDVPANKTFDVGARRMRLLMMAQLSPRFMIMAHLGANNQSFLNGGAAGSSGTGVYGAGKRPGIFFHDFTSEYAIIQPLNSVTGVNRNFSLSVGAGLHYYLGLSRHTMSSTTNFLTLDSPIFTWPTVENSDQQDRMFGIYAKGKLDKLEFRLSVNKPFATNLLPVGENVAVDNNGTSAAGLAGYLEYQFLSQESNKLPFKVGTYLGSRKVFNIGTGFYSQAKGTMSNQNGAPKSHDIFLFSGDVFLDMPIGRSDRNMAVTAYSAFYHYNFGPNYIRHMGIMNLGTADPAFTGRRAISGAGNAMPMLGTGNLYYTQAGFLIPKIGEKDPVRFQPYVAYSHKNLDALEQNGNYWDMGTNFLIQQHNAKITFQYSRRPVYYASDHIGGHKGTFTVQFQTFL